MGGALRAVNEFFCTIAKGILNQVYGDGQMESLERVLSLSGSGSNAISFSVLWSIVNKAVEAIKPFGIALIITYFLMYMYEAAAKEQITVDSLIKVLIQLVIVSALVSNLAEVINAILSFGDSIYNAIAFGVDGTDPTKVDVGKMVDDWLAQGEDTGATILIQSVLVWIVHQIAVIAIDFAAISRMIELGWRIAFAPVGIANCFEGGASSPAIKYLKGIAAVALSGAAIWITAAAGFAVSASMLSDQHGSLLLSQAALLATAGACIGIGNKIKEVVG